MYKDYKQGVWENGELALDIALYYNQYFGRYYTCL